MKRLENFAGKIAKVVVLLSCVSLSLVVLIIAFNVIGRAFNKPIPGGFDLAILCAAVSGSLAIAYTTKECAHVSVDIITDILSPKLQKNTGNDNTSFCIHHICGSGLAGGLLSS